MIEIPSLLCLLESRNKTVKLSNNHDIILGLAEVIVTGIKESKLLHRRIGPINLASFSFSSGFLFSFQQSANSQMVSVVRSCYFLR